MRSPRAYLQWSAAALLAGAGLFTSSSVIALQDAAALAEIDVGSVPRWRMHLLPAPLVNAQPMSLESFDLAWSGGPEAGMPSTVGGRGFTIGSEIAERPRQTTNHLAKAARIAVAPKPADAKAVLAKVDLMPSRDGSTPDLSSLPSIRLASATTPVEIAKAVFATPVVRSLREEAIGGVSVATREEHPSGEVITSITPRPVASDEEMARERKCMAEAIYFEARGEPEIGQYAVAQVVLNRVRSGYYPKDICGVVYENKHLRNRCQFSFACDGIPDRITNKDAWKRATEIAEKVTGTDYFLPEVGSATHYHATYVRPHWTWDMDKLQKIGKHIFYRELRWSTDEG